MLSLLLSILILALCAGLFFWAISLLPLPAPFAQVVQVVAILIFIVILLGMLFGGINLPRLRL